MPAVPGQNPENTNIPAREFRLGTPQRTISPAGVRIQAQSLSGFQGPLHLESAGGDSRPELGFDP